MNMTEPTEIMEWLNIHRSTIDSEAFVDASPAQRGTWLALLNYCAGQENGGLIVGAGMFTDRKWIMLAGVTMDEVEDGCALWVWERDESDLRVEFYPHAAEALLQTKRAAGKKGGSARASSTHDESASSTAAVVLQAESDACLKEVSVSASTKGKGREGKGMKGKGSAHEADGFAHIPSEQEFLAAFMVEGIPEDYLRRQFTHFQASPKRWLDRGDLVDWRWLVRRRWTADAQTYSPRGAESGGGSEKKGRGQSVAQQLFEIDRELADVKLRLDQAHELNQAPSAADVKLERELKNRRDDVKGMSGGLAA